MQFSREEFWEREPRSRGNRRKGFTRIARRLVLLVCYARCMHFNLNQSQIRRREKRSRKGVRKRGPTALHWTERIYLFFAFAPRVCISDIVRTRLPKAISRARLAALLYNHCSLSLSGLLRFFFARFNRWTNQTRAFYLYLPELSARLE